MDIDKPEADFMHKCIYAVTSGIVRMGGERVDGVRAAWHLHLLCCTAE